MGSDSAEEQKQGKRRASANKTAFKPTGKSTDPAFDQRVIEIQERKQSESELADVLAVEQAAPSIPGNASNTIDATPEQLGEVTSTAAPTAEQLDAALAAQTRLTASAELSTNGSNDAALSTALNTKNKAQSDAHSAAIRAAGFGSLITSAHDKTFTGSLQGISPDFLRVLVTVDEPGLTPHKHNQNVWLPISAVELITKQQAAKQARKQYGSKRSRSLSEGDVISASLSSTSESEDSTMAKKSTSNKSTKSTKSSSKSTKQGTSTGRAAKKAASTDKAPKAKRGVITSEALDALPQALRAGVEATRLNWATEKFAKPKTLKFAAGASAGGFKAAGQVWGHIDVADTEFNKFWRFHFQQKGDKYSVNRTLAYDSAEAAQNAAKYEAIQLGVASPEHFTFKF